MAVDEADITADHREVTSGIPSLLKSKEVKLILDTLETGDYLIRNELLIERKSEEDFIQSLIANRLFSQISRLVKTPFHPFLLLEGNPFRSRHKIEPNAIKGAYLSIVASWNVPIIYSRDIDDTALILTLLVQQTQRTTKLLRFSGYKPKRIKSRQLRLIQALPQVGPLLAARLLNYFGSVEEIMKAGEKDLRKVEGIGKKKADKIRRFLTAKSD